RGNEKANRLPVALDGQYLIARQVLGRMVTKLPNTHPLHGILPSVATCDHIIASREDSLEGRRHLLRKCSHSPIYTTASASGRSPTLEEYMDLSIIIVNWNTRALLADCLRSLDELTGVTYEVIVVDNGSSDGSAAMVADQFPNVRLIANAR